jgi:ppGpp synthetase/RelA/SpoT-type nucleotidyltranferase
MNPTKNREEQKWLKEQLQKFIEILPRYQKYALVLQEVLDKAVKKYTPLAIVQTRPKSIASFGEKALLKKHVGRYSDPVNRMTDLCGGRIIVPTKAEVGMISKFIEDHFEIDRENSVDVSKKLKTSEFGYRGIHYIVQFKQGIFPTKDIDVEIPIEIFGLRAEIQVKTILEHAWGVFTHDRAYKGAFKIPEKWEREMAALAAILEDADSSFARVEDGLKRYAASYGAYMTEEKMHEQIENLKIILAYDPKSIELATRIGKLAITLGDWPTAIETPSQYIGSGHPLILRDLGVAICKLYSDETNSKEYKKGQSYLEAAIAANPKDTDAIASLAGTYKGIDEDKVRALYRQAFEVDPSDPYPLGNYLECEISHLKDISIVFTLRTLINNAIDRCRDQADVDMNLPWAFYDTGKFCLLLGKPHESLTAYAKAIQLSHADWQIYTSLQSLEKLAVVQDALPGFEWVRRLLLVGLAAKFPKGKDGRKATQQLKKLSSGGHKVLTGPTVIVAGGCDTSAETQIQSYRQATSDGFWDFHGTVVSGGTTAGVSGLAGEIGRTYPDAVRTIGYAPRRLPLGARKDKRYHEVRSTNGADLSPLEPLQYWTDIIASAIPLSQVKVLGINGGTISAAEYRIALALGAQVAVLENSGGEAAKLLADSDWANSKTLICLPVDRMTIAAFIGGARPQLEPEIREIIGRAIHKNYRAGKTRVSSTEDPASTPWAKLPNNLKESNRQQADDISNKLRRVGCAVAKATGRAAKVTFTKDEIEVMAEMEHGRWNVERLLDGWKRGGKRDIANKISPFLEAWAKLPEDVKEWDRETVRKIPEFLAKVGLEVRRV